jgi:hypothetical protein
VIVTLRQGRRAYGQALANEADPQLPTPRGGPPGNRGPPARRTRAMPSALLPQVCPSMYMSPQRQHWRRAASERLRLRSPGLRSPDSGGGDDDDDLLQNRFIVSKKQHDKERGLPPKKDTKRKGKVVLVRQLERLGNGTSASHTITEMS